MCDYVQGEELRKLPMCPHIFHRACVDDWLTRSLTCPSCLQEISIPSTAPPVTTTSNALAVDNLEVGDGRITSANERRTQTSGHPPATDLREEVERIKKRSRVGLVNPNCTLLGSFSAIDYCMSLSIRYCVISSHSF